MAKAGHCALFVELQLIRQPKKRLFSLTPRSVLNTSGHSVASRGKVSLRNRLNKPRDKP